MKLKQLFADDDAVSPVIGVILMVAITVILAAVIASFVLGLGDQQETAPNASFDFNYDEANGDLTVTKSGGDQLDGSNLYVRGSNPDPAGVSITADNDVATMIDGSPGSGSDVSAVSGVSGYTSGDIGAGQGFEIDYGGSGAGSSFEMTLVFEDGDVSEELVSDEGPDA